MKTIKFFAIFLSIYIILSGCYKDLPLEVPDYEQKIVVNGIFFNDSLIRIHVSKSVNYGTNATTNAPVYSDAKVSLYKDGTFVEDLTFTNDDTKMYISTSLAEAGHSYEVIVEADGKIAKGVVSIPETAEVKNIKHIRRDEANWCDLVEIYFEDLADVDNYYFLDAFYYIKYYEYNDTGWYDSYDIYKENYTYLEFPEGYSSGTIEDIYFQPYATGAIGFSDEIYGLSEKISLNVNTYYWDEFEEVDSFYVYFNFLTVNKDIYKFFESYDQYWNTFGNPLVEPVNVYSNIEGGIGVLAGITMSTDSVKIPVSNDYYWK